MCVSGNQRIATRCHVCLPAHRKATPSAAPCPFGQGKGDLLEIGNAPCTGADQRSPPLKRHRCLRTAASLAGSRHAALRLLPFHFAKRELVHSNDSYSILG